MSAAPPFGVIGYGAITEEILRCLAVRADVAAPAAVLVRPESILEAQRRSAGRFEVVDDIDTLLELAPHRIAECASHGALETYGATVLRRGADLVIASVGALADRALASKVAEAPVDDARILIPSGAVAGIDGLVAARSAGLREVTYTSVKAPHAWRGTPAERELAGPVSTRRLTFFEGNAREAALRFPQNANVAAAVALAGLGFEATRVRLVSDPDTTGPLGLIEASGEFGAFRFEILAYASALNPKTSVLTAHSIVSALLDGIAFGPPERFLR
jgi:aspartate dehydrogenase